jgi:hypothetical protein
MYVYNVRKPREIVPNEHAGYVALLEAVAKIQDRSRPLSPLPPKRSAA